MVHRVEGKPEGTERFAIKLMEHLRGAGILPRGTWTRDYTNDNKVGYATLAVLRTLVRLIPFGIDRCLNTVVATLLS